MYLNEGDECKGCIFEENAWETKCKIREDGKSKECPCKLCIIKMMCDTPCKPYNDLRIALGIELINL